MKIKRGKMENVGSSGAHCPRAPYRQYPLSRDPLGRSGVLRASLLTPAWPLSCRALTSALPSIPLVSPTQPVERQLGLGPCVLLSDPAISDLLSKSGFQYLAFLASGSAAKSLKSEHIQWLHYHHLGLESPSLKEALKGAGWYVQKKQKHGGC